MPSHVIRSFIYDAPAEFLDVTFVSGRRYRYHGVPADEALAMEGAFAKGVFFNRRIRDRYPATPLAREDGLGAGATPSRSGPDAARNAEPAPRSSFPKA